MPLRDMGIPGGTHYLNGSFYLFDGFTTICLSAVHSQFYALQVAMSASRALADTCYFILLYFLGVFNSGVSASISSFKKIQ